MSELIVAIDQGTSSSRTVVYDRKLDAVASAQQEFAQIYPEPGWVEHDPEVIWDSVLQVSREALASCGAADGNVAGLGITNQRETTLVWDRATGKCVYNAIVWQDRRTADRCQSLREQGVESMVMEKTGLRLDPYFSASKLAWILEHVDGARRKAEDGRLAFGTIDCFLLWRLTGGKVHATDASNASRTMLFNIYEQRWDDDLLKLFDIPESLLPEVKDCAADFGTTDASIVGISCDVCGMAGDQQAALIGQAGFETGMTKSTYGTGCFVIANTGSAAVRSDNKLLTTVANRIGGDVTYGLEGSIFVAGSAVQWLRDELKVIDNASETEGIAQRTGVVDNVHVVPAFTGLGAPYWDAGARAAILGLTRDSGIDHIVTATLQAIAYQTKDLFNAMADDGIKPSIVRVDGGMVTNDWFLQFLADMLELTVERPQNAESTVLGAAGLAAFQTGLFESLNDLADCWRSDAVFQPQMEHDRQRDLYAGWLEAVSRIRSAS